MKIGLVRRGHSGTGGAEKYLGRIAEALTRAGHETPLFAGEEWQGKEWPWGELRLLPGRSPRHFADALRAAETRCDRLFSLERVWGCDVYRAGDGVHREWLDIRGRREPGLATMMRARRAKHRELLALEARLFSREGAGAVIANSHMVKKDILRHFDYPAERVHVVYNGVPLRAAVPGTREAKRRELGLDEGTLAVLFAGSGWERKGLRFAIEGVERAEVDAVLLVAGEGKKSGLPRSKRVRYLGAVAEMDTVLAGADLFLLPTLYEPFSNACLEALAAGLPVVTTRRNGFAEIIESGRHGEVLEDAADVRAIARALERWAGRHAAARADCAELAAGFSMERNLAETLAVLGV